MTARRFGVPGLVALVAAFVRIAAAQNAASLNAVKSVYVGSLGSQPGAKELRDELIESLFRSGKLKISSPADADAVVEGVGEIWVRSHRSLSPRARTTSAYVEPIYGGYLSVLIKGRHDEILWSYFVSPKRASFSRNFKRDLATRFVDELTKAIDQSAQNATAPSSFSGNAVALRGAGATFPFPVYQEWFTSFHADNPNVVLTYAPIGSEAGLKQLLAGELDFAGSDVPLSALDGASGPKPLLAFPSVVGAVVLIYNLPEFDTELRLTPEVLSGILAGRIRKWNDPAIRGLNRRSSLPDKTIQVVHRSDVSGTTFVLTEYLSKASGSWKSTLGRGATVNWPVGVGANGNDGLAQLVAQTPYSLGYTQFIYAFRHRLSVASIQNLAGQFIEADLPSITAAVDNTISTTPSDLAISISNAGGHDSYPIVTFTWLIVPSEPVDSAKGAALRQFLEWMMIAGQKQCMSLGYGPIPASVVDLERKMLQNVK
jgi:phosphate transport system substrate-binding protein